VSWRPVALTLLIAAAFAAAVHLTLRGVVADAGVAVFWPPSGVLLAGLMLSARKTWLWTTALCLIADIACNHWAPPTSRSWGVSVAFSVIDIGTVLAVAPFLARAWPGRRTLDDRRRVSVFLIASAATGILSASAAALFALVAPSLGVTDAPPPGALFLAWLPSMICGILVFGPLLFAIAEATQLGAPRLFRPRPEAVGLLAFCVVVGLLLFSQEPAVVSGFGPLLYLLFPALVWAAIRCDRLTVSLMVVVSSLIAFALTVSGLGPIAPTSPDESTRWEWLQVWTVSLTVTALYLSAVTSQLQSARAALAESEQRHRALVDAMPAALLVHDGRRFLYLNPVARQMLGVASLDDLLHREPLDVLSPDSRKSVSIRPGDAPPGSAHPPLMHQRWLRPDGSRVDARTASVACTFAGTPAVQVVAIDATELEHSAALLRESRLQLHSILGSLEDAVLSLAADGKSVLFANDAAGRLFGVPLETILQDPSRRLDHLVGEDAAAMRADLAKIRHRGGLDREYRVDTGSGVRLLHERTQVVRDEFGHPIRIDTVASDVTDRKAVFERRLREQRLFDAGPCVAWRWRNSPGWPVEFVSSNVALFGYEPDDFMSGRVSYSSVIHPDDLPRVSAEVSMHVVSPRERFEQRYRFRRRDGVYRDVQDFTIVLRDASGAATHFEGYLLDVTEVAATEREHAELSERFRQFASNIDSVLWMMDPATERTIFVNGAFERIFGLSPEEFLRDNPAWPTGVHPDDAPGVLEAFRDWLDEGTRASPEFEYRVLRPDGSFRWIHDRAFRVAGSGPDAGRIIGIAHDITDDREAATERERLLSELAQARRTEAVGSFASKITHDLKNLMMPIITYTDLSLSDLGPDHPVSKYLRNISQAASAASELTKRLLLLRDRPAAVRLAPEPLPVPTRPASPTRDREPLRILVVEDEDLVRGLLHRSLEQAGHRVHAARSSDEALKLSEELRDLDVLVADVSLPGMDGRSLHGRILSLCPGLRTVLVSGSPLDQREKLPDHTVFLPKPFSMSDLMKAVDSLTGEDGSPARAPA
jgi:PAS domain S-box-containing protein